MDVDLLKLVAGSSLIASTVTLLGNFLLEGRRQRAALRAQLVRDQLDAICKIMAQLTRADEAIDKAYDAMVESREGMSEVFGVALAALRELAVLAIEHRFRIGASRYRAVRHYASVQDHNLTSWWNQGEEGEGRSSEQARAEFEALCSDLEELFPPPRLHRRRPKKPPVASRGVPVKSGDETQVLSNADASHAAGDKLP